MPIPANQITVAEIVVKGQIPSGGSNAINTVTIFHYRRQGVAVAPSKTALEAAFTAGPVVQLGLLLSARWAASMHDVRWLNDAEDPYLSIVATEVGAVTGDRLSSDIAAFILLRTGLRGRTFKGGKHLGPMSESDVTTTNEDIWNAGTLTRIGNLATALLAPLTDSTGNIWNLTLVSRKLSQLKTNPTTVIANDVTQILGNKRVGTLLRRKVKSVY